MQLCILVSSEMASPEMVQLTQALLRAAEATAVASERLANAPSGSTPGATNFTEASKVVRPPEPFGPDTTEEERSEFPDFCMQMKAWLFYAEPAYEADLLHIEQHLDTPVALDSMSTEARARSVKFYNILIGLLKNRPFRLLKQIENRNGFEAWRQIVSFLQPHTKARSVSLLTALMNLPSFTKEKSLREQIQTLDLMRDEYRKSSGADVPEDLSLGVLIRVLPAHIRQHVQLQMKESTRYEEVRGAVLAYENVSSTWTTSKVHSEFGIGNQPPQQHQGLAPMEIDRVSNPNWNQSWNSKGGKYGKSGKGNKGKYDKGKGKGKSNKGKGKSEGKHGGKGSGKGKFQQHDDGKANCCLYCGKPGHWKRDCRAYKRDQQNNVRNVETASAAGTSTTAASTTEHSGTPSVAGSASSSQPSSAGAFAQQQQQRQVRLLPFAEQDDFVDLTNLQFSIMSPTRNIRMMSFPDMTCSDHDNIWTVAPGCEPYSHVRALQDSAGGEETEIIFDSGADGSVLPLRYAQIGESAFLSAPQTQYVDAQGAALGVRDFRTAEATFDGIRLREHFAIAPVTSPLVCLGKIL